MNHFHIVLIRGIGAASHSLITMKELETAVIAAGIGEARSVLATGNFVVRSPWSAEEIHACFLTEMRRKGLDRPLVLRRPEQLQRVADAGADHPAVQARPSRVLVHFHQKPLDPQAAEKINAIATIEDAFTLADELVVDFTDGISTSLLKLEFIERSAGSIGTARNWNTLGKILAAAKAMGWSSKSD